MEKDIGTLLINHIKNDQNLSEFQKPGLCRVWSKNAMEFLRANHPELTMEAREVDIEPGLSHTFLRITIDDESFLLDGVGLINKPAYFGPESQAPSHLLNSHEDMIEGMV